MLIKKGEDGGRGRKHQTFIEFSQIKFYVYLMTRSESIVPLGGCTRSSVSTGCTHIELNWYHRLYLLMDCQSGEICIMCLVACRLSPTRRHLNLFRVPFLQIFLIRGVGTVFQRYMCLNFPSFRTFDQILMFRDETLLQ